MGLQQTWFNDRLKVLGGVAGWLRHEAKERLIAVDIIEHVELIAAARRFLFLVPTAFALSRFHEIIAETTDRPRVGRRQSALDRWPVDILNIAKTVNRTQASRSNARQSHGTYVSSLSSR